ncbi:hypothetical protein BGZ70_009088 [Mortierella alpina]|uniref:IQ calmodulin-binding motif protein n=1 Tax=Mortierella alpina TaxID=64518 RepID=A0A9P6J2M0_MORAP|nr:hypothetical protein BGZ70_009088 [Mortierella alpina]
MHLPPHYAHPDQQAPSNETHTQNHSTETKASDAANLDASLTSDEKAKLESAATVIQSVYRGYQTRRELYGPALTASQKWRHLIDYSRIEYIHKMDAKHQMQDQQGNFQNPNATHQQQLQQQEQQEQQQQQEQQEQQQQQERPESPQTPGEKKARWAWRRAEFLGSRLGKLTEHWLEMSDKKHRYGSNLKPYHEHWLQQDTSQNFFYWLDKGDGKNLELEERPRARLEAQRVQYLEEHERDQFAVHVVDGLLYYKESGKAVHTLPTSVQAGDDVDVSQVLPDADAGDDEATRMEKKRIRNKSKYIYVTDPKGTLYVAQKKKGNFHHSSFLGGGTVCAAGGIIVNHGKLVKINPKSGHYRPGQRHFDRLLASLKDMGISLEGVKISYGILENDGDGEGERCGSSDRLVAALEKNGVVPVPGRVNP